MMFNILNSCFKNNSKNFRLCGVFSLAKQKNCISKFFCLLICISCFLVACDMNSSRTQEQQIAKEESPKEESEPENGIFRQQKSFTIDSINFTRHQVSIREGQNEETIIYTIFEDKTQFQPLNEAIADFANLARLDSIKISQESNLDADETEYETIQRIDTLYFVNSDVVNMEFNYSFMANGMECENKENKLLSYSLKSKKVMTLKDIFGAKLPEKQKIIQENLKNIFAKAIDTFAENAYQKPEAAEVESIKKELTDTKIFFENLSFMMTKDSLVFSYPVGKGCSLPSYLRSSMDLSVLNK